MFIPMNNHPHMKNGVRVNERGQKWWLDSQTVRATLLTAVPTVVTLGALFGVNIQNDQVELFVNGIAAVVGLVGLAKLLIDRFEKKDITFKKPNV